MSLTVRDINQHYWRLDGLPHLELRSTRHSTQPYKAHRHPELSIGAVVAGRTRLTFGAQAQLVKTGDVVIIEPERVHACNPVDGQPRSYHMLYIDPQWCLNKLSSLYATPIQSFACDPVVIPQAPLYDLVLTVVGQLERQRAAEAALALERLAFQVLCNWCTPRNEDADHDALAHRIRRHLLEDLVQPPTLDQLASEFGHTKETIIRRFNKQFGITPKAFINNARIEQAKLYLKEGRPIADVAVAVGFSDQSQFHRAFVAYTASTPRQYQQARSIFDNIF